VIIVCHYLVYRYSVKHVHVKVMLFVYLVVFSFHFHKFYGTGLSVHVGLTYWIVY